MTSLMQLIPGLKHYHILHGRVPASYLEVSIDLSGCAHPLDGVSSGSLQN